MKLPMASVLAVIACLAAALPAQQKQLYDIEKLRTIELVFKQTDYWAQLTANWSKKIYIKADLKIDGETLRDVGVRFRGNSSYYALPPNSKKKPFKIATDEFLPQKLWGYKTLNLNNNFTDPTMVREVLAYETMRKFTPAPRSNYVLLKINGQNWGPYVNTQAVNKDLLRQTFPSDDGNRYRAERQLPQTPANYSAFNWYGANASEYQKGFELKSETSANPWVDLVNAARVLNNTAAASLPNELPKVFDVDNVLTVFALGNALLWLDGYRGRYSHNYYVYSDLRHGRLSLIPWDMNNSFGGYDDFIPRATLPLVSPYYVNTQDSNLRPLFTRVIAHTPWKLEYDAKLRRIKDELEWSRASRRIDQLQSIIESEMARDPHRLYALSKFRSNVLQDEVVQSWNIPGLKPMIDGRHEYLSKHPVIGLRGVQVYGLKHTPVEPLATESVAVQVRAPGATRVVLRWRVTGVHTESTMFDDGQHGDFAANDGIWGGLIPAQSAGARVEYEVGAADAAGTWTNWTNYGDGIVRPSYRVTWPRRASPIRINEFVAINDTGATDEKGQREDWIELVNTGNVAINVGGLHLSDDLANSRRWRIPSNTIVQPGATVLIWADNDLTDGKLHASFKLSGSGEEIALFDSFGLFLHDHVEFGAQRADVSTGRMMDGEDPWVTFGAPTPAASNVPSCGARTYGSLDATNHRLSLAIAGSTKIASTARIELADGVPSSVFVVLFDASPGYRVVSNGATWLLGLPFLFSVVTPSDAAGEAVVPLPIPDDGNLVGLRLYLQAWGFERSDLIASNGAEITFCAK